MSESTRLEMTIGNTGDPFIYSSIDEAEAAVRDTYSQNNWPLPELHGQELLDALDDVEYTMRPLIQVNYPTMRSDYFCQYPRRSQSQPSGIQIDPEEGTLSCFVNSEISSVPGDVFRGRLIWIYISNAEDLTPTEMSHALDLIKDLAQTVCDGYNPEFDGSHWIGTLTDKSHAALRKIGKILWEHDYGCESSNFPEDIMY